MQEMLQYVDALLMHIDAFCQIFSRYAERPSISGSSMESLLIFRLSVTRWIPNSSAAAVRFQWLRLRHSRIISVSRSCIVSRSCLNF